MYPSQRRMQMTLDAHRISRAPRTVGLAVALLTLNHASAVLATWSIVAVDQTTQEVAIGSATCVTNLDLRRWTPAIVVGLGGGAVQSYVDTTGQRRLIIRDGLVAGSTADEIMQQLVALPQSPVHQNGVGDTQGHSATFTGVSCGAHASGVVGSTGTLHYAIQGNVVTGAPVIAQAEQALLDTPGDLPERLMAAMEAAREMGGDGRCSCSPSNPTGCGSQPPDFTKSADNGYMIVARYGDIDGACNAGGCARGDYFMNFNVAFQGTQDEDPVLQLHALFGAWREALEGRPDAVATSVEYEPVPGGYVLSVELIDWRGIPVGSSAPGGVAVEHAPESDGISDIGPVLDHGDGTYEAMLTVDADAGIDRFLITIDDGLRPVVLPPRTTDLDFGLLFADGFESGDTTGWSNTVP